MEEARRCPHCRAENTPDAAICTCCGAEMDAQNAPHQLPVGALLAGRYRVGGCIGEGGFGITYAGWDETLDMKVAVKEYYPAGNVNPITHSRSRSSRQMRRAAHFSSAAARAFWTRRGRWRNLRTRQTSSVCATAFLKTTPPTSSWNFSRARA